MEFFGEAGLRATLVESIFRAHFILRNPSIALPGLQYQRKNTITILTDITKYANIGRPTSLVFSQNVLTMSPNWYVSKSVPTCTAMAGKHTHTRTLSLAFGKQLTKT